ncbi:hypothetical protein AHF37_02731 [Paragonimus kellicotti]|nr:hypothetical protein AHF37_02731 [Paragonimus kellicotti]
MVFARAPGSFLKYGNYYRVTPARIMESKHSLLMSSRGFGFFKLNITHN